jgi:hypothetical protein
VVGNPILRQYPLPEANAGSTREYAYGSAEGPPDSVGAITRTLFDEAKKKDWAVKL